MQLTKTQVNNYITNYCKEHNIKKSQYNLHPLYIHLDGFSHSIGFTKHKTPKNTIATNYNNVGYTAYGDYVWGELNEHQEKIAVYILSKIPHYCYQNNAKEILF